MGLELMLAAKTVLGSEAVAEILKADEAGLLAIARGEAPVSPDDVMLLTAAIFERSDALNALAAEIEAVTGCNQ